MIHYHYRLCNYTPISTNEQEHLIRDKDEHHILLNKQMNIIQARQTCNSINSNLIEIRTGNQSRLLETFMTRHGIKQTFSGIYYNPKIQEFNGEYITDQNTKLKNLPPPHTEYYNAATTWKDLLYDAVKRHKHKPSFIQKQARHLSPLQHTSLAPSHTTIITTNLQPPSPCARHQKQPPQEKLFINNGKTNAS